MVNLNKLKALAKKNGIKQKELFEMVGRKEWFGGDIKKGVSVPYSYLETWANALHTTPAYLMDETDDPAEGIKKEPTFAGGHSLEAVQFAKEFSDLTQEDWHKLREYADFLKSRHTDK